MNEETDLDRSLQRAGERWRESLPEMHDPYPSFRRGATGRPRRSLFLGLTAGVAVLAVLAVTVVLVFLAKSTDPRVGLSVASPTAGSPAAATPTSDHATQSPSIEPTGEPSPSAPPATPAPVDDYEAQLYQQAERALDRWAQVVADAPPEAIVFVHGLTHGGGWRGRQDDDRKTAFLSGRVEATVPLPTDTPRPGEVAWPDGSKTTVPLISAAEALDELVTEMTALSQASCPECRPLEVVGARLVVGESATSRGTVTVPLWQFEFDPADQPMTPITHVAVRDRISVDTAAWENEAPNALGHRISAAYGSPDDTELTVLFTGAPYRGDRPCGADYTAEAVESDLAVVVIVRAHSRLPPDSGPQICRAIGAGRTAVAMLDSPLGDRTVLEVVLGTPVERIPGEPLPDEVRNE